MVIEKPFGRDLSTAKKLNDELSHFLTEDQIYRIDHYLGKETVQNIIAFRFANGLFEPLWNRDHIDHVQITAAEAIGIEQRGRYYDQSGVIRDMVPNHLFQLLTLIGMEPPAAFDADAVRNEQVKVLTSVVVPSNDEVRFNTIRGQYDASACGGIKDYRSEQYVPENSIAPTYAALKLSIDNWRWTGVPFYLRTGKRLPARATEISVCFKQAPFALFRKAGIDSLTPNWLVMRLQPDEGISLSFGAKKPGALMQLGNVEMDFSYQDYFGQSPSTGYERLLYDCLAGDATLFQRSDMVETAWSVVAPILEAWEEQPETAFPNYQAGTWGPKAASELLTRDGRHWRNCKCVESIGLGAHASAHGTT